MRRKITLLGFMLICFFSKAFAQLPDGATAPDWTLTDLNGQSWHLYDILEAGKPVFLDFSATWCGPCWNYHNTHALRDLYDQYGPEGTDEVMVFFIEADNATNLACLYGPSGCVGGTMGNWVAGTTYPIINDASQNGGYAISYFPTIYKICPNKIIEEVGQIPFSTLVNEFQECSAVTYTSQRSNVSCFGSNNGSIDLTVTNGLPPFSFNWSNGAHTEDISGLAPGTYKCTITGTGGSKITDNIVITQPSAAVSTTVTNSIPQNCGEVNGQITVSASGGTPGYSYEWDNGTNGPTNTGLEAGTYVVTVTDNNGCTASRSATISNVPAPVSVVSGNGEITCNTPSLVLSGAGSSTGPGITYLWTTPNGNIVSGATTLSPTINAEGDYYLRVRNTQYQCDVESGIYISGYTTAPNADAGPDASLNCTVTSVQLNGSASSNGAEYSQLWTTTNGHIVSGATTLTPTVDEPGTYVLTLTNIFNGCSKRDSSAVILISSMSVSGTEEDINCNGSNSGSISVDVSGGAGTLSYAWSNGSTNDNIDNLAAGVYTLTVTDAQDCSALSSFTITEPPVLVANASSTNISEANANDGTASAQPSGGVAPYTYLWSNGETTQTIEDLAPGAYTVEVRDANGCITSQTVGVSAPGCALIAQVTAVTNVTCYGGNNGSATVNTNGGTGEVLATWPGGLQGATQSNLAAGTYQVSVLDENGCPATIDVVIDQPSQIQAEVTNQVNVVCPADATGALSLNSSGGAGAPYTYVWSNGATGSSVSGLTGGQTGVEISDANGCSVHLNFTIQSTDDEVPTVITLATTTVYLDAEGQASLEAAEVDLGSTDNCAITTRTLSKDLFTCEDLGQKLVVFTAGDANGNKEDANVIVNVVDQLAPVVTCPAPIVVYSCEKPVFYTVSAADNCTPDMALTLKSGRPSGSYFPNGVTNIVYSSKDASGNEGSCAFTVTVISKTICEGKEHHIKATTGTPGGGQEIPLVSQPKTLGTATLFPNPANQQLTISLENWKADNTQIEVFDLQGKRQILVDGLNAGDTTRTISTAGLANGLYLVRITGDGARLTEKVSIQH